MVKETIYTTSPSHSNKTQIAKEKLEAIKKDLEKAEEKKKNYEKNKEITEEMWKTILENGYNKEKEQGY